ncbi:hypothetical protein KUCAC02_028585 [Chaenocephalus aceratus]|uniref:Uncharacterized protein n=1 Tax=Chaenocephalus aceratus TaxID=36190 RepID=A0ACB9X326_CHAAC|nr:hypothetical protein KUCAC02_028585 [Chaenocephalus aceratus]
MNSADKKKGLIEEHTTHSLNFSPVQCPHPPSRSISQSWRTVGHPFALKEERTNKLVNFVDRDALGKCLGLE